MKILYIIESFIGIAIISFAYSQNNTVLAVIGLLMYCQSKLELILLNNKQHENKSI